MSASRKQSKGKTPRGAGSKKTFSEDAVFKVTVRWLPKEKNFHLKVKTDNSSDHEFSKTQKEMLSFVNSINKKHGQKGLKSMQAKNKDLKGNSKQVVGYVKEWMKTIAENPDLSADKALHDFIGAKGALLADLQGNKSGASSAAAAQEESKQNDMSSRELQQMRLKYQQAQQAIEQLKAERDSESRKFQQSEAQLRSKLAQSMADYQNLEQKYTMAQDGWEEQQEKLDNLEKQLSKKDAKDLESKFPHLAEKYGAYTDPEEMVEMLHEELEAKQQENVQLRSTNLNLIQENEQLKLQGSRANWQASEALATLEEVGDKETYVQLLNDYREAEAEIDDLVKQNQKSQKQLETAVSKIKSLEDKISKDEPKLTEFPELKQRVDKLVKEKAKFDAKLEISEKRSKQYQQNYEELKKEFAGMVSREKMEAAVKEIGREKAEAEGRAEELQKKLSEFEKELDAKKGELTDAQTELGKIVTENEKLLASGGKDVNLDLNLDLMYGFSLFKQHEFEFGTNISREQLKLWADHVKKLTSEIHEEFVAEVEELSRRTDLLEEYIEANGLPSPEDSGFSGLAAAGAQMNDLPHPVPSMTLEDIDRLHPTKNQLREYIDLMFSEWRSDDNEALQLLATTQSREDAALVRSLRGGAGVEEEETEELSLGGAMAEMDDLPDDTSDEVRKLVKKKNQELAKLKKQLEQARLEVDETKAQLKEEYTHEIGRLEEKISTLKTRNGGKAGSDLGTDGTEEAAEPDYGMGPDLLAPDPNAPFVGVSGVSDAEHEDGSRGGSVGPDGGLVAPFPDPLQDSTSEQNEVPAMNANNKMEDLERQLLEVTEYSHKLEDEIKQVVFDFDLKLSALQREHEHDIEGFSLQLEAANEKVVDAAALQDNDFATNFNDRLQECWEIRDGETTLKLRHIEEIRELERTRDSLLREVHSLRIKNERYEQNVDERVRKLEEEKEKLERENEHFSLIASSVSDMKEEMDRLQATRDALEQQMQDFEEEKKALHNQMEMNESRWKQEVTKHQSRATSLQEDLKKMVASIHGAGMAGLSGVDNEELKGLILTRAEADQIKEDLVTKEKQLAEAIKSKIKLIQTSSYEIDRLRDEIRLFSTDPSSHRRLKKYDLLPNAYNDAFERRNRLRYRRGLKRLHHGSFGLAGQVVDEHERRQLRDGLRAGRGDYAGDDASQDEDARSQVSFFSDAPLGTYQDLLHSGQEPQEPTTVLGRAYSYTVGVLGTIGSGITGALGYESASKADDVAVGANGVAALPGAQGMNGMNGMNGLNGLGPNNAGMPGAAGAAAGAAVGAYGVAGMNMYAAGAGMDPAAAAMHNRMMSANMSVMSGAMGGPMHVGRPSAMSFGGAGSVYSGIGQIPVGTHNHTQSQLSDFARNAANAGGMNDPVNRSMFNIAQRFEQARFSMQSVDNADEEAEQMDAMQGAGMGGMNQMNNGMNGMNGMEDNGDKRGGFTKLGVRPARHARLRSRETKLSMADIAEHNEREDNEDDEDMDANVADVDISQPLPQKIRKKTHSRTLSTMVSHYGKAMDEIGNFDDMGASPGGGLGDVGMGYDDGIGVKNYEAWAHEDDEDILRSRSSSDGNGNHNVGGGHFDNISVSDPEDVGML